MRESCARDNGCGCDENGDGDVTGDGENTAPPKELLVDVPLVSSRGFGDSQSCVPQADFPIMPEGPAPGGEWGKR